MLVAACDSNKDLIKVFLPEGDWYLLNDGRHYPGDQVVTVDAPVHRLPVFVRGGSVLIMQDPIQNTEEKSSIVHFHIYPGKRSSEFEWYMDDGSTYAYQSGGFNIRTILSENGKIVVSPSKGSFNSGLTEMRFIIHGKQLKREITVNNQNVKPEVTTHSYFLPMLKFDPLEPAPDVGSETVCHFAIPYTDEEVVIEFPPV